MTEFTYYGDLLGIGNDYSLGANIAKQKLLDFYSITHHSLSQFCFHKPTKNKVFLFSDSIIIKGDDALEGLELIAELNCNLLVKDIFLRGGIVKGYLDFEPMLTINDSFEKNLPKDDTLARAAGLEKLYKGARLIIENELAAELFVEYPRWSTNSGYMNNSMNFDSNNVLSRIAPTPDNKMYEYLYYWSPLRQLNEYNDKKKKLSKLASMYTDTLKIQFKETIGVIERSKLRHEISLDKLHYSDLHENIIAETKV